MSMLFTADIHITENPRDAHRWGLFKWIREQVPLHKVRTVGILGDLTDAKDRHASKLVNHLVDEVFQVAQMCEVIILAGNHDYIDPNSPFFGFLSKLGGDDRITFVKEPTIIALTDNARHNNFRDTLWLPSTKNWKQDWDKYRPFDYRWVFTHQTYAGIVAENGYVLDGIPPSIFAKARQVWSGDIHGPQMVADNVGYIGSPYRVDFGDDMVGRVLLVKDGEDIDLHFPCKNKHVIEIEDVDDFIQCNLPDDVRPGDQVKMRVYLRREEFALWPQYRASLREYAKNHGLELFGPELVRQLSQPVNPSVSGPDAAITNPAAILTRFCADKGVGAREAQWGQRFIEEAK